MFLLFFIFSNVILYYYFYFISEFLNILKDLKANYGGWGMFFGSHFTNGYICL